MSKSADTDTYKCEICGVDASLILDMRSDTWLACSAHAGGILKDNLETGEDATVQLVKDQRLFARVWGPGYEPKTDIVNVDVFAEDEGYSKEVQRQITDLAVWGQLDLTDIDGHHSVRRIK